MMHGRRVIATDCMSFRAVGGFGLFGGDVEFWQEGQRCGRTGTCVRPIVYISSTTVRLHVKVTVASRLNQATTYDA
jgi:hypothetical protein